MGEASYERPRVDDRTSVSEPLNVVNTSGGGLTTTPVWGPSARGDDPVPAAYEPPGVAEQAPVSEPLNAASSSHVFETPTWRSRRDGS
jgi:hypothetical protein